MDTELEDVWYSWLGSSSLRFLKSSSKSEKSEDVAMRNKPVSKVEEHINNLTESLSKTQVALERAGEIGEEARREHAGCSEALAKQENENIRLEFEISKLYEEVESCHWKQGSDAVTHQRLELRIQELVREVKQAEQQAEENRGVMANERLIHLQERETLRVVQTEHEDCLASLRVAQDILAEYSRDVAFRDASIQDLRRQKGRMTSKITHLTSSLRTTAKELGDTKRRLAQVSHQLRQAEDIIQTHFTMLSSLETYKSKLTEELDHLRTSYDKRTLQLVSMRETLQERNSVIAELREELEAKDNELLATKLEVVAANQQLADSKDELAASQRVVASAENDINELRDRQTKLDEEKIRQLNEMDQERNELKQALKMARQENGSLKSDLAAAAADAAARDEKLAEEIAAHQYTTKAAAAQKVRLQNSIENLKGNLAKANGDLRRTRETLFALNEKCHTLARAQVSLSSYRAKSKLLLDTSQSPERKTSGEQEDRQDEQVSSKSTKDLQGQVLSEVAEEGPDWKEQGPYHQEQRLDDDVSLAFMLKVKAQEQSIQTRTKKQTHSRSLSGETLGESSSTTPTPTSTTAPPLPSLAAPRASSLKITLPTRESLFEPPVVTTPSIAATTAAAAAATTAPLASPKSVRFSLLSNLSDEGYQTDEDKAATSEDAIFNIISDLDRARRDYKVLRKRQRRRNLKTEAPAPAPASSASASASASSGPADAIAAAPDSV